MKNLLLLLFLLIAAVPRMATAQDAPVKSFEDLLPRQKKIPPTAAQMDESFRVFDACHASDMVNRFYDCECLSSRYLIIRPQYPKLRIDEVSGMARKACANTTGIAGDAYNKCLEWAPAMRSDYDRYCSCYANAYATNFSKSPSDTIRGREGLMTNALNRCNTGREIQEQRERRSLIQQLREQGLYKTLFPNATPGPRRRSQPPEDQSPDP